MDVNSCDFVNLDEDLRQELLGSLEILQLAYERGKTNAINEAYNRQKKRNKDSSTRAGKLNEVNLALSPSTLQRSPVLCKKSKRKKCARASAPHLPIAPDLPTNHQTVFKLTPYYSAAINHDTYVINKNDDDLNRNRSSEELFKYLDDIFQKRDETQMLTLSLYFHQSSVFLAFVLDDIHVKIFVKKDKKWIELRSVVSEEKVWKVAWMQDGDNIFLLVAKSSIISISRFNDGFSDWWNVIVGEIACMAALPEMKLFVCEKKINKYSFIEAKRSYEPKIFSCPSCGQRLWPWNCDQLQACRRFEKEMSLMSVQADVIALCAVSNQTRVLLGCSSSNFYVWNVETGNLLRQLPVQDKKFNNLISSISFKGVLGVRVLMEEDGRMYQTYAIVNPYRGKIIMTETEWPRAFMLSVTSADRSLIFYEDEVMTVKSFLFSCL